MVAECRHLLWWSPPSWLPVVCLILNVVQVVLDHLGCLQLLCIAPDSLLSRTSVSAAYIQETTEPSERGQDLLTLHKISEAFSDFLWSQIIFPKLFCQLCFLLDFLTTTLLQVYPKYVEARHRNNICHRDSFTVLFLLLLTCAFFLNPSAHTL